MEQLKKCPFCGGEARMQKKFFNVESVALMRFQVACMECGANNDWYTDKGYAIKAWNTRKPMERIVERLKACQDRLKTMPVWEAIKIVKEEM